MNRALEGSIFKLHIQRAFFLTFLSKIVGGPSLDDDKDFDYGPPTDLSLEEAEDDIEEYEGSPSK